MTKNCHAIYLPDRNARCNNKKKTNEKNNNKHFTTKLHIHYSMSH